MPITLQPLSRRRFLSLSLASGAALALGNRFASAAANRRDPDRFALLSDIHIPTDPAKSERGVNMTQHMRQAVDQVLNLEKSDRPPAGVIINGDLAHHTGEIADYRNLLGLLAPISAAGLPVHLAMGNHDQRQRFWATVPYEKLSGGNDKRAIDHRQVLLLRAPRLDWIILDTLDKTNATPGLLGPEQLGWLKYILDAPARADKPAAIMIHHDPAIPAAAPRPGARTASTQPAKAAGLTDSSALFDVVLPRKQVKALIFGHTHVWSIRQLSGLHLINLPTTAYVFDAPQPSAWVDCRVAAGGMRLELHCLNANHPKNGDIAELRWRN